MLQHSGSGRLKVLVPQALGRDLLLKHVGLVRAQASMGSGQFFRLRQITHPPFPGRPRLPGEDAWIITAMMSTDKTYLHRAPETFATRARAWPASGHVNRATSSGAPQDPDTDAPGGEGRHSEGSLRATRATLFDGHWPRLWLMAVAAAWLVVATEVAFHWM